MEVTEEYEKTALGGIPVEWRMKHLNQLVEFTNGKAHENSIKDDGKYIVVNSKFISTEGEVRKYSDSCFCPTEVGNILLVMSDVPNGRAIAKCFFVDKNNCYTVNQRICSLKAKSDDPKFLFYAINRNRYYLSFDDGVKQTNLRKDDVLGCPVPLPPTKAEQATIAEALSDADALISRLEQLIAKKRNIKQGAMQELLTGKKRLPGFSGEWEVKKLGEIADVNMGQSPDSRYYNTNANGIPLIQGNADIENRKSLKRVWTTQITKSCNNGDLIMTVRAPVGSIGTATEYSCIGRGVCSLIPKGIDEIFLFHLLVFGEGDWKIIEQGSTFTAANSDQIRDFQIALPADRSEQTAIAQILSDMDGEIEQLGQKLDKYRMIKQGMMQELLTGKTRLI